MQIKKLVKLNNYVDTYIIGYSSDDGKEIRDLFLNAGASTVIRKPSRFEIIKELLDEIML